MPFFLAACLLGLGLLAMPLAEAATRPLHPTGKLRVPKVPTAAHGHTQARGGPLPRGAKARPLVRKPLPGEEIGLADVVDHGTPGLRGLASFYGHGFQGRRTSTGERFDVREFTGASNHFPLGSRVAVRRLDDARCAIVRINDRMHGLHRRRVIDVSRNVAEYLGMLRAGVVLVRVAAVRGERGEAEAGGACLSAFVPEETACSGASCGQPSPWPDFPGTAADETP